MSSSTQETRSQETAQRDVAETLDVLNFRLRDVPMCIDIRYVESVVPLVAMEPIPTAPAYVRGLLNVRGTSVPALDLAGFLALRSEPYTLDTPIVLCCLDDRQAGLIVGQVLGLETVPRSGFRAGRILHDVELPYAGVITHRIRQSLVLDLSRVLNATPDLEAARA